MTDPATIVRTISTRTAIFEERGDGIVIQRLKPGSVQSLADARENIDALLAICGERQRGLLFDLRGGLSTESGVRETYAKSEGMKRLFGIAMVINSTAGRIAGNFLIAVQLPTTPTRLFTDEAAAMTWLFRLARGRS